MMSASIASMYNVYIYPVPHLLVDFPSQLNANQIAGAAAGRSARRRKNLVGAGRAFGQGACASFPSFPPSSPFLPFLPLLPFPLPRFFPPFPHWWVPGEPELLCKGMAENLKEFCSKPDRLKFHPGDVLMSFVASRTGLSFTRGMF